MGIVESFKELNLKYIKLIIDTLNKEPGRLGFMFGIDKKTAKKLKDLNKEEVDKLAENPLSELDSKSVNHLIERL